MAYKFYNELLTTSNAALARLLAGEGVPRIPKNRLVVGAAGSAVLLTRVRGGCWRAEGQPEAVAAIKARLLDFAAAIALEKATSKAREAAPVEPVSEARRSTVVRNETFKGRAITVSRISTDGKADRYLATSPNPDKPGVTSRTGTDPNAVYKALLADLFPRKRGGRKVRGKGFIREKSGRHGKADAKTIREHRREGKLAHNPFAGLAR